MTTVVSAPNSEVTTPASYVSRWIAQSHGKYQKKADEYYASSYDYQPTTTTTPSSSATTTISIIKIPSTSTSNSPMTTWEAQAKTRFDVTATSPITSDSSLNTSIIVNNNNDLQEKLNRVRALLDAKKQRLCRHLSSTSTSSSTTTIAIAGTSLQDQVRDSPTVGDQSSSPTIPSSSPVALENVYHPHDESLSSSNSTYVYNPCHHHTLPSILPCLMEESPSDSGLSDGTKTTNHDDSNESASKNPAIIDLSQPLSKEEMLAIIQIIRELWRKRFDCEIPDLSIKPPIITSFKRIGEASMNNNNKSQYHSTPVLNKLNAELNNIKDKLIRFSAERQQKPSTITTVTKSSESENSQMDLDDNPCYEDSVFVPLGAPLSSQDLERMQAKKDALLRRQLQRREEIVNKRTERQAEAAERHDEYRLFEEYISQRRQDDDQRRTTILQAHLEQKRCEADPPSSHDYYFTTARMRNRLKRKASITSFLSLDDALSYSGSLSAVQTPKRNATRFDFMSPSITAPTAASKSKMNRASSICNINGHYNSSTSLHSKSTIPASLFGGSLMNLSKTQTPKKRSSNLLDDTFSESMTSLVGSITGTRVARSQTLSTKSNKQTILNSLKQAALAGPANERQREIIIREIESNEARHFVLLFRDHRLQFRAVYMYIPETDVIEKLHGAGPHIITELMVDKWFKYNSGSKRFNNIPIKHFSIQCDAVIIYNDFWQKKLHTNKLH